MKAYKVISIITIILLVIILSFASFAGIYKLKDYKIVNAVPQYLLGMEFSDSRIINLTVSQEIASTKIYDKDGNEVIEQEDGIEYTEENGYTTVETKVNSDDLLTQENYEKTKSILIDRLNSIGSKQHKVKLDNSNGNIKIEMTEDENTDRIISSLIKQGTFELIDGETEEVLIETSSIKSAKVVYGQTDATSTGVYLQLKFNKDGQAKLKDLSGIYIQTITQTTNEDGETEDKTETKSATIMLNGENYGGVYFEDVRTDGILNIQIGSGSDSETIQEYIISANELAIIFNTGTLPITYENTNYTTSTDITEAQINMSIYIAIAIVLLMIIYLIIKLKTRGLLAGILYIGYIALLLLTIRYTNIIITMEGIVGILLSIVISYMYIYKVFKHTESNFVKEVTLKISLKLIPIYIIAIIFTFNSIANISSLGMTLVWGILTMYLYNLTLTQIAVKTVKGDK